MTEDNPKKTLIIGYHARKTSSPKKTTCEVLSDAFKLVSDNMHDAIPCAALFISGPRNTHLNITKEEAREIARVLEASRRAIVFHASYMDLPWSAATLEDDVFARVDSMLGICALAGADIVIHSSTHIFEPNRSRPILQRLSAAIEKAHNKYKDARIPRIFIETMSYDERFGSPKALNAIFDDQTILWRARDDKMCRIGLCIDTAHIWAAGADISTRLSCGTWFESIRADIPVAMHLNDSLEALGTRNDVHTTLGNGEIWSIEDGYVAALAWARRRRAPVILERNDTPELEAVTDLHLIASKLNI